MAMAQVWRLPFRGTPLAGHSAPVADVSVKSKAVQTAIQVSPHSVHSGWLRGGLVAALALPLLRQSARSSRGRRSSQVRLASSKVEELPKPVPVILLSGFLGTGKTTLLRHWLENSTDRVGVVVNDVAAVNIDSKLVQQETYNPEGEVNAIQLQNGCACCSLGDELLVSIYDLLELATQDKPFSKIVVELSGVAEPQRVKENFDQAKNTGYYVTNGFDLSKVVTLLDASTFCEEYMAYQSIVERDDLMDGDIGEMGDYSVVELLVEQAEAADVVVLNKTDLADKEQIEATKAVVKAINSKATILETSYSKIALETVLGASHPEHAEEHGGHDHGGHDHSGHDHENEEHGHSHASDCHDPECTDASHGHGHSHSHAEDCNDPECTDPSHGHSHGHEEGHSHSHSSKTTAEERFGITSFTYRARRPFSEARFTEVLKKWPVPKHTDLQLMLDDAEPDNDHPMAHVIRSKGFCWLEQEPSTRVYWSHAGKDMKLSYSGVWWAAMTDQQVKVMERIVGDEYERARKEDWNDECGDRRQEIVFIGQKLQEAPIRDLLDGCLLTDEEWDAYKKNQEVEESLAASGNEAEVYQAAG